MPHARKKIFGAYGAARFAHNLNLEKDGFEKLWEVRRGGGGVGTSNKPPPLVLPSRCFALPTPKHSPLPLCEGGGGGGQGLGFDSVGPYVVG